MVLEQQNKEKDMLHIYPTLQKQQARSHGRQHTGSVRVKITAGEKKAVLELFKKHSKFYKDFPELYYQHHDRIGYDKVTYTTSQIIADINKKIPDWKSKATNDIYESYLLRHNHIVTTAAEKISKMHDTSIADEYIDNYFIQYGPPAPKHTPDNGLWE